MNFESAEFDFNNKQSPLVIAEVGVNHNANMDIAKRLVDEAQKAGADIVKFQAFVSEEEISQFADKADYQKKTTGSTGNQLEMAKALELSHAQLIEARDYCNTVKMPFLCSAFEDISLKFLIEEMGVKTVKIASSEVTNIPFLENCAISKAAIILSTGASSMNEVSRAVKAMQSAGMDNSNLALMHCVSNYPAEISEINLKAISSMKKVFGVPIGYSDHTAGWQASFLASAMGAQFIEKHFTLDCNMEGPDHKASIEPAELKKMCEMVKLGFQMAGNGIKEPVPCEIANRSLIRKSIVARHALQPGHILQKTDLAFKRPASGIEPFDLNKILGKCLTKKLQLDEALTWEHLN